MPEILLPHGNYQELASYQNCMVIFDATNDFCACFLHKGDRTIDQMIQAARSGKQNIVEGCVDSVISTETEIKLLGVARGSLAELLTDYQDFLRLHDLALWDKNDAQVAAIRQFAREGNKTYTTYKTYFHLSNQTPELFCNLLITLIHQTNYLLDRQLKSLEKRFLKEGGLRERMYRARTEQRRTRHDEALALLRELYRDVANLNQPALLEKIKQVAELLKDNAKG